MGLLRLARGRRGRMRAVLPLLGWLFVSTTPARVVQIEHAANALRNGCPA